MLNYSWIIARKNSINLIEISAREKIAFETRMEKKIIYLEKYRFDILRIIFMTNNENIQIE